MVSLIRSIVSVILIATFLSCGPASAAEKLMPLNKAFPFLKDFLTLPASEREHFTIVYYLKQDGKPPAATVAWIVDGENTVPLVLSENGRVSQLPSLALLNRAKLLVRRPDNSKVELNMAVEPTFAPAQELDAARLAAAVAEADAGAKRLAGVFSFVAPDMEAVSFKGVASGEIIDASGKATPLPVVKGSPVFVPSAARKAVKVRLSGVPTRMLIVEAD